MAELILKDEVYAIAGAAMEVYYQLGTGFLEPVYQESLQIELAQRRIPFESQKTLELFYKDVKLEKKYIPDFVCYQQIIVEIKVLERLTNIEVAQLMNYLKITKMPVGLLINFGSRPKLEWKRYVWGNH
jgi:GxxExxY protein